MNDIQAVRSIIDSGLALLPDNMDSLPAVVLLLAISGQEADFRHRWQVVDGRRPEVRGPARGLWQFERGVGAAHIGAGRRHVARSAEHVRPLRERVSRYACY